MNAPNPLLPRGAPPRRGKSAICFKILNLASIRTVPIPLLFGAMCALVFCSNPVQAAPDSPNESGCQLTIELRDGSRVVGKSLDDTLSFHSAALGDMKLSWAGIRSIEYAGTNASVARLTAANGDGFSIQLAGDTLRVETAFGRTELPVKLIRSVKVTPPAKPNPAAGTGTARLTIELRDGSHVVGKGLDDAVNFHSPEMGDLKLAWAGIRSIEYAGTNTDMARLTATNGDVYEVQFAVSSLGVKTSFGKTELPVSLIRTVKVSMAGQAGPMPSGLVAWWKGDGNATDSAGHFDGQVSGGLRYVPGPTGQAFQFNGGSSTVGFGPLRDSARPRLPEVFNGGAAQVDFGSAVGNFGSGDFTVAFWIKTDSRNPHEAFLGKRATCDAAFSHWEIQLGGGGYPYPPPGTLVVGMCPGGNGAVNLLLTSRPMNDGQWHHVAWVRQSTSAGTITCLIYVDGALDNSKVFVAGANDNPRAHPDAIDLANQAPLVLGQSVCQGFDGTRPYSGAAADLRLFSQALSAEEIITIYQTGKSGQ